MSTTTTKTIFTFGEAKSFILPFDKFQGKTIAQAYTQDSAYVEWLAKKMNPRNDVGSQIKAAAIAFLAGPQQTPSKPRTPAANGNGNGRKPAPQPQARSNGHKPAPKPADGDHQNGEHPRIFSLVTNKAILHLEDTLEIGKVKLFMVAYVKGKGASATVVHYVNLDDARVLAAALTTGKLPDKYVEYKGSPTARDGKPLSRVLKVGDMGEKSRRPIVIQVQNGPGKLMGEGAISPIKGQVDAEVTIFLTRWEARRLGHALQDYIQAWETARMLKGV